jgi:glutathione S-transferase
MLELYHSGVSTCSQKVRLALAEKGLDFTSHAVDLIAGGQHDPAYVKLNPNHVVPTLIHDGTVLIESSLINEYVDEVFPGTSLRPEDPVARHAMRLWIKRIDEKVHPSAGTVTFAIGPRALLLQQPEAVREANIEAIPDPKRRAARRSVIEHGVEAPEFQGALDAFLDLLDAMEAALAPGGWLAGGAFGLADAAVLPYVMRLDHLAMTPLVSEAQRPRVAEWYARVQERPSFETAVRAWLPEPVVALFRTGGEAVWSQVEPLTHRA